MSFPTRTRIGKQSRWWFDFSFWECFNLKACDARVPAFKLNFIQLCESNWQVIYWDQWSFVLYKWVRAEWIKLEPLLNIKAFGMGNPFQLGRHWNVDLHWTKILTRKINLFLPIHKKELLKRTQNSFIYKNKILFKNTNCFKGRKKNEKKTTFKLCFKGVKNNNLEFVN